MKTIINVFKDFTEDMNEYLNDNYKCTISYMKC